MIVRRRFMPNSLTRAFAATATIACALATTAHAAMVISNTPTKNVDCTGGVCTPTKSAAVLSVSDLQAMLAGSDVTVKATATAQDINVLKPLAWTSTHRLTLDAYRSIHVRAPIAVEGTSGLTLATNDGGTDGSYDFATKPLASIAFWDLNSSLVINGQSYTLVGDIQTLASGIAANRSGNFALARDYDASVDGVYAHAPVTTEFSGTFEGLNNAVANLTISDTVKYDKAGLFVQIGASGIARDLRLESVNVSSLKGDSGGLVGENDGTVTAVSVTGTFKANRRIGGLVGNNFGTISNARASASVHSAWAGGGLVGDNHGSIVRSSASGAVSAAAEAGGLVGLNNGIIDQSFATGPVTGSYAIGGLVGLNAVTVTNCYALGRVTAKTYDLEFGGLVGFAQAPYAQIASGYATGKVSGPGRGGGVFGDDSAQQTSNLYWDLDTSGITDPHQGAGDPADDPGVTGLTDAQLKSALPAGFDPNVWGQNASINNGWPYLLANPPQ
jgi:hypothetical protein